MTFHGTLASINTALATATYTPDAEYNGAAQVTISVTDTFGGMVATGTGAAASDSDIVAVTVDAVNDAPVPAADALAPSSAEDSGTRIILFTHLTGNDARGPVDEAGQSLTVTNVANAVGGTVAIVAGHVEFTLAPNFNGTASFDYTATDDGTTNNVLIPRAQSDKPRSQSRR